MKYLLDISALLAWEHPSSPHHVSFHVWSKQREDAKFWTCAHTELGFLRVSMQVFNYDLSQATEALASLKAHTAGFILAAPSPRLPAWAGNPAKTSDGYLVQLALANGMKLGTVDRGIKDTVSELIGET